MIELQGKPFVTKTNIFGKMGSNPPQREPRRTSRYREGQVRQPHWSLRREINMPINQTPNNSEEWDLLKVDLLENCLSDDLLFGHSGPMQRPSIRRRTLPSYRMRTRMESYSVLEVIQEEPIAEMVEQDDLTEEVAAQADRVVRDKNYINQGEHTKMKWAMLPELVDSDDMKPNMQLEQVNDILEGAVQSDTVFQKDLEETVQPDKVQLEEVDVTIDLTMMLTVISIVQNDARPARQEEIEPTIQPSPVEPDETGPIEQSEEVDAPMEPTTQPDQVEHEELGTVVKLEIDTEPPSQTG